MVKTIGILGSGQLGRMIAMAAASCGMRAHIFAPDAEGSPAGDVAFKTTTASYDDEKALLAFADEIDGITSEFENVPSSALAIIAQKQAQNAAFVISPGIQALDTAQDRLAEKQMAQKLSIMTPRFWAINSQEDLDKALVELDGKGFLKTRRDGYDGKGQMRIATGDDTNLIWQEMGNKPLILEKAIAFQAEASFLVARDAKGKITHFPAAMNHHIDGILATSTAPAPLDESILLKGMKAVEAIAQDLSLCGILAMESFVSPAGDIIFNEIAPRPHNSFHWTIEGANCSQFEQLARIASGLPMKQIYARGLWRMENLLGQHGDQIAQFMQDDEIHTHIYGKHDYRAGRKIGHITYQLFDNSDKSNKVS